MFRRMGLACSLAFVLVFLGKGAGATPQGAAQASPRLTITFDNDWRFFKGEPAAPASTQPANGNYPPIDPPSHAFKDDAWRRVTLPHDWSIEGPFDEKAATLAAGAYLPSGVGWYRKTFTVPAEAKGKRVFIEFDGVMANSDVWINKGHLGHRPNGYVPFQYDLTDYLDFDGPNVIAVRTDTTRQPASRWYTGAGIYRHVRLVIENGLHVNREGTWIFTRKLDGEQAEVVFHMAVVNDSNVPIPAADIDTYLKLPPELSEASKIISTSAERVGDPVGPTLNPGARYETQIVHVFRKPQLWDISSPILHNATVSVELKKQQVDVQTVPFGIRSTEFKADSGFWLNGKNIKLKGVCLHHDAGALGAAVPMSAWESRLSALKKFGVNAVRTAHAPMSPEFYEVCDRLGLLVMDEAFDAWTVAKEPGDYSLYFKDWWQKDLEAIIRAHRNHPSIVIYSLGNEIWDILPQNPDPALDQFVGPKRSIDVAKGIFVPMRDLVHHLDPTRPVTLACMRPNVAGIYENGFADLEDVIGQNYRDNELAAAHEAKPTRKIIGTENYKTRETWLALRDNPALAGQFLWAGVDYLGEAGRWPNFTSRSGMLDRTNAPKVDALERAAWWSEAPVVYLARVPVTAGRGGAPGGRGAAAGRGRGGGAVANWSPENVEPHAESVNVYSNCEEVELFLNDKSLGSKRKNADDAPRAWQVTFAPGTLRAVGRNKGAQVASDEVKTAGAPAQIKLMAERPMLPHDGDHVMYVRGQITDAEGIPVTSATNLLKFTVSGPGEILATDNGSSSDHTPFASPERAAVRGTCIAIVRATADSGAISITATSEGLPEGSAMFQAQRGVEK